MNDSTPGWAIRPPTPLKIRLVDAAAQLFAALPYDAVRMADIAPLAGTSKANIYNHVRSKEQLFLLCHQRACDALFERLRGTVCSLPEAAERRAQLAREIVALQADRLLHLPPQLRAAVATTPGLRDDLRSITSQWSQHCARMIRSLCGDTPICDTSLTVATAMVLMLVWDFQDARQLAPSIAEPAGVLDLLERLLAPQPLARPAQPDTADSRSSKSCSASVPASAGANSSSGR